MIRSIDLWNKKYISLTLIAFCAGILLLTCYFRPPLGDDILEQFKYCDKWYHSDPSWVELPPKDTWKAALEDAWHLYNNWSGRVFYLLTIAILTIWGQLSVAISVTLIYCGIVIAGGRLLYGSIGRFFEHPLAVGVLSSLIMLYNYTMDHSIMWTFASIYGMSYMMYLIMVNYTKDVFYDQKNITKKTVVIMNFLGFIAGITNELIGAWYIIQIVCVIIYSKGIKGAVRYIYLYLGMIIGYLICFFAPGNFVRARSGHDRNLHSSYLHRLYEGASQHAQCILKMQNAGIAIGLALLLCTFIALIKINKIRLSEGKNALIFLLGSILVSWLLWSVMAYTPVYGMVGMLLYVILLLIKIIDISDLQIDKYAYILSLILLVILAVDNVPWICRFGNETIKRNSIIEEAIKDGKDSVVIPPYSEDVCRHVVFEKYTNSSEVYAGLPEIKFFGIKIIINETNTE